MSGIHTTPGHRPTPAGGTDPLPPRRFVDTVVSLTTAFALCVLCVLESTARHTPPSLSLIMRAAPAALVAAAGTSYLAVRTLRRRKASATHIDSRSSGPRSQPCRPGAGMGEDPPS